jgi:hypothetical protein
MADVTMSSPAFANTFVGGSNFDQRLSYSFVNKKLIGFNE